MWSLISFLALAIVCTNEAFASQHQATHDEMVMAHHQTEPASVLRGYLVAKELEEQQQKTRLEIQRNTQSKYCITGYIMDTFCIGLQTLLDKPNLISLEFPDQHSVHCLTEVSSCVKSGYEVLGPPPPAGANYTREVKLDSAGNTLAYDLAKLTGICSSCSGRGTIVQGFRATVSGVLTGSGDPPMLAVDQVVPASVSCSSLLAATPTAPVPAPTVQPTERPTPSAPAPVPTVRPSLRPTLKPVTPTKAPVKPVAAPTTVKPSAPPTTAVKVPAGYCFSETNTVNVMRKGKLAIKDLQIGDFVEDADGSMVRVYSFGHYQPHAKTQYLQLHANGLSHPLEISPDHLVFLAAASTPIPASLVSVGDKLRLEQGRVAEVVKIESVERKGAYAPFTTSGALLVSGVAVSSYVTLQPGSPLLMLGNYSTIFSMHWLAHIFQAPHRMTCEWNMNVCRRETYSEDGISTWVHIPLLASRWLLTQNEMVMTAVFAPTFLVGLFLHAVELANLHGLWFLALAMFSLTIFRTRPSYLKSKFV